MTEQEEAVMAANALLDVPYADPDDDLRMLSRQLLRRHEELAQLQAHNKAMRDALQGIADGTHDCQCEDHTNPDCCVFAKDFCCQFCIARAALTLTQEKP